MTTIDQAAAAYFATLPSIPSDSTRHAFRAGFEARAALPIEQEMRAPVAVATSDAERAAFEAWWRTSDVKFDDLKPSNWLGWQARAATPNPDWNNQRQAEINDWFLSLPEGRQKALLDGGRWELAGAAFNAGRALPIDFKQATDQGGWQWVPKQPTLAMVKAAFAWSDAPMSAYRAMLAAAPTLLGVADGDAVGGKSGGAA